MTRSKSSGVNAGANEGYIAPGTVDPALFSALLYCTGTANLAAGTGRDTCLLLNGANSAAPPAILAATTAAPAAGPTFTAGAHAVLVAGGEDRWTISNTKVILNTQNGIL